jgi:menaquinone-dependent protoporphyrinogen oxidase
MNVLVTFASKHGSTREIAEVIATTLQQAGIVVDQKPADEVISIDDYDGVVIGSAIYYGQWQDSVLHLIERVEVELQTKDVWLFSSGPVGEDPFPAELPPATADLVRRTGAAEHQSFTGKLDRTELGLGERLVTAAMRAPAGDFRDWDAIRAWARSIAESLLATPSQTI